MLAYAPGRPRRAALPAQARREQGRSPGSSASSARSRWLFVFYVNWIPTAIPNDIFAALPWPLWALPYVFLVWTAVGLVWYQTVRRRNPQAIANAGRWGEQDEIPVPAQADPAPS